MLSRNRDENSGLNFSLAQKNDFHLSSKLYKLDDPHDVTGSLSDTLLEPRADRF